MDRIQKQDIPAYLNSYGSDPWSPSLRLFDSGCYQSFYAPMDHINHDAKVVLVGITPGVTQAKNALKCAKQMLRAGADIEHALEKAKVTASFSGSMRNNLVRLLDHIGLNACLSIDSCEALFGQSQHLCHFTSILRYPTLDSGKMLASAKPVLRNMGLNQLMEEYFVEEIKQLPDAVYIPLGQGVAEVLTSLIDRGLLKQEQVLIGLPHPSGANAERIKYFLLEKIKDELSKKTNAELIDQRRLALITQMSTLQQLGFGGSYVI